VEGYIYIEAVFDIKEDLTSKTWHLMTNDDENDKSIFITFYTIYKEHGFKIQTYIIYTQGEIILKGCLAFRFKQNYYLHDLKTHFQ
jgi:hypothetical protein